MQNFRYLISKTNFYKQLISQPNKFTFSAQLPKEPREEFIKDNEEIEKYVNGLMPKLKNYNLTSGSPSTNKLVNYRSPSQLSKEFDFTLGQKGCEPEEIIDLMDKVMYYSVKTNHPRFFDKLYVGTDPIGQISEFMISILNTNVHTYAVAPMFAVMETYCVKKFAEVCGYNVDTADGILVPGGTFANITALMVARHEKFPHVREDGWLPEDQPVMFTSVQCHYSVSRGAMMAGMGMKNCKKVAANVHGSMCPIDLEKQIVECIEQGKKPFFISATSGTTVMGGFDDIEAISKVAKKYNIWLHVDACWGGTALFSERLRHLMKGIEYSDSCALDPHKGLGVSLQTTVLVTNNKQGALEKSNSSGAVYLFHKHEASAYDLADKTLQCGRRADALKMWMTWKKMGLEGFQKRVEKSYDNATYMKDQILKRPESFKLVSEEAHWNVCFWYIPPCLRGYKNIEDIYPQLNESTQILYQKQQEAGSLLINFNPLEDHGLPRFNRITLNSDKVCNADMDFCLDELDRLGQSITLEQINARINKN